MLKEGFVNYSHTDVIVLIGFSGVGKTYWGPYIAEQLSKTFYDSDVLLSEQEKMTVCEIFSTYGESYFRAKEHDILQRLIARGNCVIATGGGVVEHPEFLTLVGNAHVWFLNEPLKSIAARMSANDFAQRPLWEKRDVLWERRYPLYMNAANACTPSDKNAIDTHIEELQHV